MQERARSFASIAHVALVLTLAGLLLLRLPTWLLDLLIAMSFTAAIVVLTAGLSGRSRHWLRLLPTALVMTTVFRLALNISSTRLILSQADAGRVISAFGELVAGGNYVVGAVLFGLITTVNLLVIARGAERFSEVAARFSLDALPGWQLAIDADLRAGAVSAGAASRRRAELQSDSATFGALDGAMKFVKGDAIAGIIITAINIVGGIIVGVVQLGKSFEEAARVYLVLAIGDGLVTQIPALLVAAGAALAVAGAADDKPIVSEAIEFARGNSLVLGVGGASMVILAVAPGLPALPLATVGGVVLIAAVLASRARGHSAPSPGGVLLEIGRAVDLQVDAASLRDVASAVAIRLGLRPLALDVRVGSDDASVTIWVDGLRVDSFMVPADAVFAERGAAVLESAGVPVVGVDLQEPGGAAGSWVARGKTVPGVDLLEPGALLEHRLEAAVRRHAPRLLTLAAVGEALDEASSDHEVAVREALSGVGILGVTAVLRGLLAEGIAIRRLDHILEAVAACAVQGDDVATLERTRGRLGDQICAALGDAGVLHVHRVSSSIEEMIVGALRSAGGAEFLALGSDVRLSIESALGAVSHGRHGRPIVVTSRRARRLLRDVAFDVDPNIVVLAEDEISRLVRVVELAPVTVRRGE